MKLFARLLALSTVSLAQAFSVRIAALLVTDDPANGLPSVVSALNGYGIPFDIMDFSRNLTNVPLEDDNGGRYSVIVFSNGVPKNIQPGQVAQLDAYEAKYGARRVGLNTSPVVVSGVTLTGECCANIGVDTLLSFDPKVIDFTDSSIKTDASMSAKGLYHYRVKINDPSSISPVVLANPSKEPISVWKRFPNGRNEMHFFIAFGDFSMTSSVLHHVWISWAFRRLYPGIRRVYLSTQVDDVFLGTRLWDPQRQTRVGSTEFRIKSKDLERHAEWMSNLNARLPSGSNFKVELAFNGNGVALAAGERPLQVPALNIPYEFKKPSGTGTNVWPANYDTNWNKANLASDELFNYASGPSASNFNWLSHTFTHYGLNNATSFDTEQEISANQKMASNAYMGLEGKPYYSPAAVVTPMITGLFNGDALAAMFKRGISSIVGDNSRLNLIPSPNRHWPIVTTKEVHGFDGMSIIPRFATEIYFDTSRPEENVAEYNFVYSKQLGITPSINIILERESDRVLSAMFSLLKDPHMFHQANMRVADLPSSTLPNGQTGSFSLLMMWVENVASKFTKIANWPVLSVKQDDLNKLYAERIQRDLCGYQMWADVENNVVKTVSVSSASNCKVPVTVPGDIVDAFPKDQLSPVDYVTYWVDTSAQALKLTFINPFLWNV